jgi:hypothetical protein
VAYVTYHPSKSILIANVFRDYSIDSNLAEYEKYHVTTSNTDTVNIFKGECLVANVSELDINMHELLITKKQLGNFRWGWLLKLDKEDRLLTFDSNNNLCLDNKVVVKFSGDYNRNFFGQVSKIFKRGQPSTNSLKLEFDESIIEPSFAFCLLFKEICKRSNS